MNTLITLFVISLGLALLLTPIVSRAAKKYNLIDIPDARKVHQSPIPRAGGIAVYLSFYISFVPVFVLGSKFINLISYDVRLLFVILGGCIVFGLGLVDDIRGVKPNTKFLVQMVAALVAFIGGVQIDKLSLPGFEYIDLGWFSLPVTVFWVLLVVNAINLIDGLDGLAAGVTFFVSMVLIILCVMSGRFEVAIPLAALAGATLGFLRYNFNPASIFLGDSGSYFLGYMLATLSMLGSIKGHATVAILIPIVALGLPLMDTFWSSIRRFVFGQRIFNPDRDHFHHRLLKLGYTQKRAVLTLYAFTIGMGTVALLMVHSRDSRAALLLLLVGATIIFGIRKLGYLEYLAVDKLVGWVNDITDEMGIKRDRRTFLAFQMDVARCSNIEEFWSRIIYAGTMLKLDYIELKLGPNNCYPQPEGRFIWHSGVDSRVDMDLLDPNRTFFISIPLEYGNDWFGTIIFAKAMDSSQQFSAQILRRIEHLRRTAVQTIANISRRTGVRFDQQAEPTPKQEQKPLPFKIHPEAEDSSSEFHPECAPADDYKTNGRPSDLSRSAKSKP